MIERAHEKATAKAAAALEKEKAKVARSRARARKVESAAKQAGKHLKRARDAEASVKDLQLELQAAEESEEETDEPAPEGRRDPRGRFEAGVGWRVRRRAGGGCDEAGRGRSLAPLRQFDGLEVARTRSKTPSCSTKVNEMLHLFDFWRSTNEPCSRRGRVAGSLKEG